MYLIKERIEEEFEDVYIIFSPLSIGQIDLFVDIDKLQEMYENEFKTNIASNSSMKSEEGNYYMELFMFEVFRPKLFDVSICGIRGIKDFYIQKELGSQNYFVETEGTNVLEILKLPYVNQSSVKTNHMWDVYDLCGIEGTRKFLLEELKNIVSSDGTYINPCHLTLLIDLMTFNGVIQSISRYGVKKEQNSVLTKSSFEESLEHFSKAGFFSENEPVKSVSASIMCGKRSNIGSGLCSLKMNWTQFTDSKK
jgi:DNA-directed RNA polymerase beta' subunit